MPCHAAYSAPKALALLFAALVLAGCAGLASRMEPPMLSVAGLKLESASLFEQTYRVRLRIRNPNAEDLPIEAMRYRLDLNGEPFASGISHERVRVPAYGSAVSEMEAVSTLASIFRQFDALGTHPAFDYRLRGRMYLADGSELPFDYRGDVAGAR